MRRTGIHPSVSAVVVTSGNMRERTVFIGSISVWDTIGTLPSSGVDCYVISARILLRHGTQGASLGAWRAALCARPTGAAAPERLSALRPPLGPGRVKPDYD